MSNGRGSASEAAAAALERAEEARRANARRYSEPLRFGTVRGALAWYARTRGPAQSPRGPTGLRLVQRCKGFDARGVPLYEEVLAQAGGSQGVTLEDVRLGLLVMERELSRLRDLQPGRVRALSLTLLDGDPDGAARREGRLYLTQEEAAHRLNCSQQTVSDWIAWCERQLLRPLVEAGLVVSK